jgi:hypothetical protein
MANQKIDRVQQQHERQRRLQTLSYLGVGALAVVTAVVVWLALTR